VTQRDRIMLGVIATVAVLAAAWMLAIKPKRAEVGRLTEQATQAQVRRDTALATLANAKQARQQFAGAQIAVARMGKAVPTSDDIATVVYQLEGTARKAGIDFRSLSLDASGSDPTPTAGAGTAAPDGEQLTKVPFKLTFEGKFFELRRFINLVHSFTRTKKGKYLSVRGRLFTIDGVSLVAGRAGFPDITAKIIANAYTAAAPTVSAAGAPGAPGAAGDAAGQNTTASATTATATGVAAE
jgi:Tfp pilus assembly protein PilO